ncbi:MAG: DUF58 domain-containing protein [Gemmataceae bacterium]|nr:DUF58 domain-containing protein [Gemmataceae bacterium]
MKWFLGAALVLFVALVLETGLLAYAMYVLLGVMVVSRFLARSWTENLSAERRCDRQTAEVGDEVAVAIVVRNAGALPVPWVLLEDMLPARALVEGRARLRVRKKRVRLALIWGRGCVELDYRVEFRMRGYYQIGPLVLESGDLFGLHRRYRVGTAPQFVLVYPQVVPLEGYDLASRRPVGEIRLTHRLYEDPTRIAGVRQYEAGDPLNRVHWRATARTGVLHSKLYEPSVIAGLTVLLDLHAASYPARGEPYRSELAVTAAASLAHAVYQLGQQVGLVTNGRDAADRIRQEGWTHDYRTRDAALASAAMAEESDRLQPLVVETRRGPEQFHRILETLARVELTDGLTVPQLVVETASRLPRDATVAAVLGEVTAETALALGNLKRRGYAVTALLVIFGEEKQEAALARLLAEGIDVRDVHDEASLAVACRRQVLR